MQQSVPLVGSALCIFRDPRLPPLSSPENTACAAAWSLLSNNPYVIDFMSCYALCRSGPEHPVCCATAASKTGPPSCATEPPSRAPKTPQKRDPAPHPHPYGSPPCAWAMATHKPMGASRITRPSPAKARAASAWPIRQSRLAGFGPISARNLQKLSQQLPNLRQRIPSGHRRPSANSGRDGCSGQRSPAPDNP
jgi:hypothetical protein